MDIEKLLESKETIDQNVEELKEYIAEAKLNGDWTEVKRIQTRVLALDPDSVRAICDLVAIANKEENWAEVKRLQTGMLELDPNNMVAIQDLIEAEKN